MWHDELATRVRSTAWDRVAALSGVRLPVNSTLARLTALADLAEQQWDFRRGAERSALDHRQTSFCPTACTEVVKAAAELGMVHSTQPVVRRYDGVLVPGGAGRAPLERLAYALEQRIECAWIAMLGSDRAVSDGERARAGAYAAAARTEFDLMAAAVEVSPTWSSSTELTPVAAGYDHARGTAARLRHYPGRPGPVSSAPVWCLSAPAPAGRTRAATEHTFELLRATAPQPLRSGTRLLIVTNALYAPYQQMHAQRVLATPGGVQVEAIGFSARHYGGTTQLSPFLLLQEMKSYVDSLCRFAFPAVPAGRAA